MAVALTLTTFFGFAHSYFFQTWTGAPPLPILVHVHGVLGSTYMMLFVIQTVLVGRQRIDLHRQLGWWAFAVAILFFLSAFPAGFAMAHVREGTPDAIARLALPFVAAPVFILLVYCAVHFRHQPGVHRRLMVFAAIDATIPAIGRLPYLEAFAPLSYLAAISLFLLAVVVYDLKATRRLSLATILGGGLVFLSLPARVILGRSDAWQSVGRELLAVF